LIVIIGHELSGLRSVQHFAWCSVSAMRPPKEIRYNKSMKLSQEEVNVVQEALLRFTDKDIESDDFYSNEEMDRMKEVREEILTRSGVEPAEDEKSEPVKINVTKEAWDALTQRALDWGTPGVGYSDRLGSN